MKDEKDKRYLEMKKVRDDLFNFKKSPLYKYRTENNFFPVIGEGDHYADIMFIGEAPGKHEALQGRPFIGSSGKFLTELIESIGLKREDVYITNIVKDRPEDNRDPRPDEIELYTPFLDKQIEIIQPKVIATLGRFSMEYILKHLGLHEHFGPISKIHGQHFRAETSYGGVEVIPLYHPAAALYNGSMREVLKEDFKVLKQFSNKK